MGQSRRFASDGKQDCRGGEEGDERRDARVERNEPVDFAPAGAEPPQDAPAESERNERALRRS